MGKTIVLTNNKGGVGKSTSATEFALGLTLMMQQSKFDNSKVLVIDTDSQAHASLLLTGGKPDEDDVTLYTLLDHYQKKYKFDEDMVRESIVESSWNTELHVLRAHQRLDEIENSIKDMPGGIFALDTLLSIVKDEYQVIIFDTCPKFSPLTEMSIIASDQYYIPVAPAPLDADGLVNIIDRVGLLQTQWRQSHPTLGGILVVKFSTKINGHNQIRDKIKNEQLSQYYLGTVPINVAVEYAQDNRMSVLMYNNGQSKAAQAYIHIIQNLAGRIFQTA